MERKRKEKRRRKERQLQQTNLAQLSVRSSPPVFHSPVFSLSLLSFSSSVLCSRQRRHRTEREKGGPGEKRRLAGGQAVWMWQVTGQINQDLRSLKHHWLMVEQTVFLLNICFGNSRRRILRFVVTRFMSRFCPVFLRSLSLFLSLSYSRMCNACLPTFQGCIRNVYY